jgi:hypothetical protein
MSWSLNVIGRRDQIQKELNCVSAALLGDSKREFDAAKPHLDALVQMNSNSMLDPILQLEANGHAGSSYSNCNVRISHLSGKVLPE